MFNRRYTFESLVKGASNHEAYDAALRIADTANSVPTHLILMGDYATGKTHLLHAIGNQMEENHIVQHLFYCTGRQLGSQINEAVANHTTEKLCQQYREYAILLIDSIQDMGIEPTERDVFFRILDDAHRNNRQIVITVDAIDGSTMKDCQWDDFFQQATVINLQPPDDAMRKEILRRDVQEDNLSVDDEVIEYILETCSNMNIKELKGVLVRTIVLSSLMGTDISVDVAEFCIAEYVKMSDTTPAKEGM